MLALPCCRRGGSVDYDGGGAEGASAIGSGDTPRRRRPLRVCVWGGVRGACPPLTWLPSARAAAHPAGGSSPRHRAATQSRRNAAENVKERRRWLCCWGWGGAALLRGVVGVGPAVRAVPPRIRWRRRRPRGPARGRRPSLQVGGRKDQQPPRPFVVAPHFLSPPG